jgi:hypothetical protein
MFNIEISFSGRKYDTTTTKQSENIFMTNIFYSADIKKSLIRFHFQRARLHNVDQHVPCQQMSKLCLQLHLWKLCNNDRVFSSSNAILYLVLHHSLSCCKVIYLNMISSF